MLEAGAWLQKPPLKHGLGLGVLNGMPRPTHSIYLCKLCLQRSGVLCDRTLLGPIIAGFCLSHAAPSIDLFILLLKHG